MAWEIIIRNEVIGYDVNFKIEEPVDLQILDMYIMKIKKVPMLKTEPKDNE